VDSFSDLSQGTTSNPLTIQAERWVYSIRAISEAAYARRRDVGNVRNRALACNRDLHLHRGCAGSSLISYPSTSQRGGVDSFYGLAGTYLARRQTTLSDSLKPVETIIPQAGLIAERAQQPHSPQS
jgi:hypothetical protein